MVISEPNSENNMYPNQTEQEVIREIQAGNTNAFTSIFNKYHLSLYYYFIKRLHYHDKAEDMVQETFLRAFEYIIKIYNPNRNRLKSWLFCMAHNLLINEIDKQKRQKTYTVRPEFLENIIYKYNGKESFPKQDIPEVSYIRDSIDRLNNRYRLPLLYFYYYDKDYNKIAEILGIPIGSVKSRLNRAREKIKKEILKDNFTFLDS